MSAESPGAGRTSTVVALLLATVIFTIGEGSVSVLLSPHLKSQRLSQATIGPVVAAFSVAALLSRPLVGSVYRPRRSQAIILGGCTLSAAAFLGIAVSTELLVLGCLTALNRVGFAMSSATALASIMELGTATRPGSPDGLVHGRHRGRPQRRRVPGGHGR